MDHNSVHRLLASADQVIAGHEITEADYQYVPLEIDRRLEAEMNGLWQSLRRFDDDADIRAKDADYDQAQREAVAADRQHLQARLDYIVWGRSV
jgi:hypothetical protein